MPVSGLVVTLSDDEEERAGAVDTIAADERLTIGEAQKNRLPVVAETETIGEGSELMRDELLDIDGVVFVDLVTVNFEDDVPTEG